MAEAFGEALASFRAWVALERGLSPRTLEAYGRDVRAFTAFLARRGRARARDIARADVVAYLELLRAQRKRPATRARAFVALREFLRHLRDAGWTPADVSEGLEAPKK